MHDSFVIQSLVWPQVLADVAATLEGEGIQGKEMLNVEPRR